MSKALLCSESAVSRYTLRLFVYAPLILYAHVVMAYTFFERPARHVIFRQAVFGGPVQDGQVADFSLRMTRGFLALLVHFALVATVEATWLEWRFVNSDEDDTV